MIYYLVNVTISSNGTEDRQFTPYDVLETAQRKYHEALTGIGAGSRKISVCLLDSNLNQIQKEVWQQYFTISLNNNGVTSELRVEAGNSVALPNVEAPTGTQFMGWSLEEGGEVVENPYTPTGDVTLYAVYQSI